MLLMSHEFYSNLCSELNHIPLIETYGLEEEIFGIKCQLSPYVPNPQIQFVLFEKNGF